MARSTAETLALSALINTQDALHLTQFGVQARHFSGYRSEFEWIENYIVEMGKTPVWDEFLTRFPDFPASQTQDDARWPVAQMFEEWSSKQILRGLMAASTAVRNGEPYQAKEILDEIEIAQFAAKPTNMLIDDSYLSTELSDDETIRLPWSTPQSYTSGIAPGELWYVGARPNQGKSWVLLNMAVEAAMQGCKVVIYSLEMTKFKMQQRAHVLLAQRLGVKFPLSEIRTRRHSNDYRQLVSDIAANVSGEIHIHTPAEGRVTPQVVAAAAADYDMVIVDHVGLMRSSGGSRSAEDWRTAAIISNELKEIALASQTRVVAAVQINRQGEGNRPPTLDKFSGTDAYGQDADVAFTLHRPSEFTMQYQLVKNRDGQNNVVWFSNFDAEYGLFNEITRAQADQIRDDMTEDVL